MIELSHERIAQILHEETVKKEATDTILRAVYTRYMRLYERYFADIDALNEERIAGMREEHQETESLVRYYYMDLPQDVCKCLAAFDSEYTAKLLGPEWHAYLSGIFKSFRDKYKGKDKSKAALKAAFAKQTLEAFYDAMDYVFRDGFGTGSKTVSDAVSGITSLLFGKQK